MPGHLLLQGELVTQLHIAFIVGLVIGSCSTAGLIILYADRRFKEIR